MFETQQLLEIGKWSGIATIAFGVLAGLAFVFKWGFRFRLVGVTGFMGVLTSGIFALSLGLYTRPSIPGAVHYARIFDAGADQVVIAVPPEINESQLDATLHQASLDLFSPGRLSMGSDRMVIRARTLLHPKPGVSQLVFLGEVRRSISSREDENATFTIDRKALAQLPQPKA
jgi:Protein of function (DUF2518)